MDSSVLVGSPFDELVRTLTEERKCNESNDNLTGVDVAGAGVGPVVRGRCDNAPVRDTDGDVGPKCQAVEAHSPEDVREEEKLKGAL